MKGKVEMVIARYNEDLGWLKDVPKNIKITIYNKGEDDISYPYIRLPNIGRESHTYLYHIINNYDNLAERTIFCQGDSIFHSPDFIELLKNIKLYEPVQPLSAYYWPGDVEPYVPVPPLYILNQTKELHIKGCKVHVEYVDNDFNTQYPNYYYCDGFRRYVDQVKRLYKVENVLEFNIKRFLLKDVDKSKLIPICFAGLFSVTRDVIRENSVDYYNNIMSILIYDRREKIDHGLFLEKLWLLIFNYKKNNKNYKELEGSEYVLKDYELKVINNEIRFKIFIIECDIYMDIYIDDKCYSIGIGRKFLLIFINKKLVKRESIINRKDIQELLKEGSTLDINVNILKGEMRIICNNVELMKYKTGGKIKRGKIYRVGNPGSPTTPPM